MGLLPTRDVDVFHVMAMALRLDGNRQVVLVARRREEISWLSPSWSHGMPADPWLATGSRCLPDPEAKKKPWEWARYYETEGSEKRRRCAYIHTYIHTYCWPRLCFPVERHMLDVYKYENAPLSSPPLPSPVWFQVLFIYPRRTLLLQP